MARKSQPRADPKPTHSLVSINLIVAWDALNRDLTLYADSEPEGFQPVIWLTGERHRHVIFIRTEAEFHDFALLLGQLNGLAIKRIVFGSHSAFQFCKAGHETHPLGPRLRMPADPSRAPDVSEED